MLRSIMLDLYVVKKYLVITTLLFVAMEVLLYNVFNEGYIVSFLFSIFLPMGVLTRTFYYDSMNNWERLRATMPFSKRDIVFGRYALGAALIVICSIISLVFTQVLGTQGDIYTILFAGFLFFAFGIEVPMYMYFGYGKVSQVGMLVFALPAYFVSQALMQVDIPALIGRFFTSIGGAAVFMAICVAVFVASAFVSVNLYSKRNI